MTRLLAQLAVLFSLCLATGGARADDADALFSRASDAYRRGDFEEAANLFAQAQAIAPSANKRFNEAQSRRRAGQSARAADGYRDALSLGLEGANRDVAERKLAELKDDVGRVRIEAPSGTQIEVAHIRGKAPIRRHVEAGAHEVTLTFANGETTTRIITVEAGQVTRLDISLVPQPARPGPAASLGPQSITGIALMSLGGASGIVAGALGARFLVVLDDYEATDFVDTSLENEALALRTATNVMAVGGAVLGMAGLVVFLTAPGESADVSLRLTPQGARLRARF